MKVLLFVRKWPILLDTVMSSRVLALANSINSTALYLCGQKPPPKEHDVHRLQFTKITWDDVRQKPPKQMDLLLFNGLPEFQALQQTLDKKYKNALRVVCGLQQSAHQLSDKQLNSLQQCDLVLLQNQYQLYRLRKKNKDVNAHLVSYFVNRQEMQKAGRISGPRKNLCLYNRDRTVFKLLSALNPVLQEHALELHIYGTKPEGMQQYSQFRYLKNDEVPIKNYKGYLSLGNLPDPYLVDAMVDQTPFLATVGASLGSQLESCFEDAFAKNNQRFYNDKVELTPKQHADVLAVQQHYGQPNITNSLTYAGVQLGPSDDLRARLQQMLKLERVYQTGKAILLKRFTQEVNSRMLKTLIGLASLRKEGSMKLGLK